MRASPDGYTLLLCGVFNATNAAFYDKLNFNFLRDIAPVAGVFRGPYVMVVNPSVPTKTVPELIAYAKANPRKLNMASPGTGAAPHLAGELFKMVAGIDLVHVPYRGGGPAVTDLIAGQVQVYFATTVSSIEYVRTGRLARSRSPRPLARRRFRTSRPWLGSCRAMRQAVGSASARPRARRSKSSTCSTRRSTRLSVIPR